MKVNILNGWEIAMIDRGPDVVRAFIADPNFLTIVFKFHKRVVQLPGTGFLVLGPGTASQCSEEQAKGIVERLRDQWGFDGYKNYAKEMTALEINVDTALESLHSYIRANGKEPETTVVIFKPAK